MKLRIRVYRPPLRALLVTLEPADSDPSFSMLVDCGVVPPSNGRAHGGEPDGVPIEEAVAQLIDSLPGRRVDVILVSNTHTSRVRGFAPFESWASVGVGEVWLPWLEGPTVAAQTARTLLDAQARHLMREETPGDYLSRRLAAGCVRDDAAMLTLHGGFAGDAHRWFLSSDAWQSAVDDETGRSGRVAVGPVAVQVLTSPADRPSLSAIASGGPGPPGTSDVRPFDDGYTLSEKDFHQAYGHRSELWRRYEGTKLNLKSLGEVVALSRKQAAYQAIALEAQLFRSGPILRMQLGGVSMLLIGDRLEPHAGTSANPLYAPARVVVGVEGAEPLDRVQAPGFLGVAVDSDKQPFRKGAADSGFPGSVELSPATPHWTDALIEARPR